MTLRLVWKCFDKSLGRRSFDFWGKTVPDKHIRTQVSSIWPDHGAAFCFDPAKLGGAGANRFKKRAAEEAFNVSLNNGAVG
jgi:hypothetical protein